MIGSHTALLIRQAFNGCVYLVTGQRNAQAAWGYVSVPSAKEAIFQNALLQSNIDLAKFGKVLFSGKGAPPEEIAHLVRHYFIEAK